MLRICCCCFYYKHTTDCRKQKFGNDANCFGDEIIKISTPRNFWKIEKMLEKFQSFNKAIDNSVWNKNIILFTDVLFS